MKRILLILLFTAAPAYAADIPVVCDGAGDRAAIQAAWDSAAEGDTVTISGTCGVFDQPINMGTSVATAKQVTIQGDGTAIIQVGASGVAARAFTMWTDATKLPRVTNLTIQQVGGGQNSASQGALECMGNGKGRFDHITFLNVQQYIINFYADCLLDSGTDYGPQTGEDNRIYARNGTFGGVGTGGTGVASGTYSLSLGSVDGAVVENMTFYSCVVDAGVCTSTTGYGRVALSDGERGSRLTFRFNTTHNMGTLGTHGTEGVGNLGWIKMEAYGNKHIQYTTNTNNAYHLRSGNGVIWGNNFINQAGSGYGFNSTFTHYRRNQGLGYLTLPGNTQGRGGWYKCGGRGYNNGAGYDYEDTSFVTITGSHDGTNGSSLLQDTSKAWTANQFRPTKAAGGFWGVCNVQAGSTWEGLCGAIYDNTAQGGSPSSAIYTYEDHTSGGTCTPPGDSQPCWASGDDYEIRFYFGCIDQPGYAPVTGTTIPLIESGGAFVLQTTGLAGWRGLVLTPFYGFLNTICTTAGCGDVKPLLQDKSDDSNGLAITTTNVIPELHYYNQAEPDNDASCTATSGAHACGVRVDEIANRNASCTLNVAFWATDEGSWNDGSHANYTGQGQLYRCTATNTWTLYYTPLDYPHPWRDDSGGDPEPELNIGGLDPNFGSQNTTVMDIEISGVGLEGSDSGMSTVVNVSGTGVTVSNCVVQSDVLIDSCDFAIDAGATAGDRDVTVTTDEGVSNALTFSIIASAAPLITSVTPSLGYVGTVVNLTITGSGFGNAGACSANGPGSDGEGGTDTEVFFSGLVEWASLASCTVVSDTVITARLTVTAATSTRNIQVETSGGLSNKDFFSPLSGSGGAGGAAVF